MAVRRSRITLVLLLGLLALAVPGAAVLRADDSSGGSPSSSIEALTGLGTAFTYQGRLEQDGDSATGVFDLRFVMFDSEVGGTQVGSTVQVSAVAVVDGFFTVELDFGPSVFAGDERWLEVAIKATGSPAFFSVLNPRQPIRAVPYALYAKAAELALPFAGTGESSNPDILFAVTQEGSGVTLEARRSYAGATEAPSLYGFNAGAGAGVQGEASAVGAVGVRGVATGATSVGVDGAAVAAGGVGGQFRGATGVVATSSNDSVALELGGGALKVSGDTRPAFVHTVVVAGETANLCGTNGTVLDHPLLNGTQSAIILVSHVSATGATASEADSRSLVLAYSPATTCAAADDKWVVFGSGAALAAGEAFNVLVVSQ